MEERRVLVFTPVELGYHRLADLGLWPCPEKVDGVILPSALLWLVIDDRSRGGSG